MSRQPINQWERRAFTWYKQGLSLREIQHIFKERGLKMSHEFIRQGIKRMEVLITTPVDNRK